MKHSFQKGNDIWKQRKTRVISQETRKKIGLANKGKTRKGHPMPENLKKKLSNRNKGRKLTDEHKEKLRQAKLGIKRPDSCKGENHHNWKGGITKKDDMIRRSVQYKLWRKAVFERDNYTCIWCGIKSGNGKAVIIQADHIKPFSLYPELRFAIDNGRTLCKNCHKTTDTFGNKIKNYKKLKK